MRTELTMMKSIWLAASVAFAAVCLGSEAAPSSVTSQLGSFKATLTRSVGYEYEVWFPVGYAANAERRWPTLLYLHGSGENARGVSELPHMGPAGILNGDPLPGSFPAAHEAAEILRQNFIVITPLCPPSTGWEADALIAFLDDVSAKYRVDAKRVYVTGVSMGGFGAWSVGLRHPDRFAGVVPIMGGGDLVDVGAGLPRKGPALGSLPIWVFHGAKDVVVPLSEAERMIAAVKRVSHNESVRLSAFEDTGHDAQTPLRAYTNPELYQWFLAHAR